MKVFVTGFRGIPAVMGGVESHCEELLPRVALLRPDVRFTVLGRRPYLTAWRSRFRGVEVQAMPAPRMQSLEAIVSTAVAAVYARLHGARILHLHAVGPALLAPFGRLLGMRVVFTHHGEDYQRAKWGRFQKALLKRGEAWGMGAADSIIVVAPSLAARLADEYPKAASRIVHIPNGTAPLPDSGSQADAVLREAGYAAGDYVLTVGRLVPEKAFDHLIDAIERVPDRRLLIVGGVDHGSDFADSLRRRAGPRVVFAGPQSRATLRDLYRQASLFVLPSLHEGLPIVALEAASLDTPVLLSDIPANRDLGLSAAHYFRAGDRDDLTAALSRPSSSFAIDGSIVRSRFDWDHIAEATAAIYDRLR